MADPRSSRALRFVLLMGAVSLFADFAYEGARSVLGPWLDFLGASGLAVGAVTGFGELVGYGLRLVSGRLADRTKAYWPLTLAGYALQMVAIPALALTRSWPAVACLIVLERAAKAVRTPAKSAMLSHAGKEMGGYGWTFGLHEALDQAGALIGPLVVAAVFASRGDYRVAFAILGVPAAVTCGLVLLARFLYPRPEEMEGGGESAAPGGPLPRVFWLYFAGAALVAAGLADYPLLAFHFTRAHSMPEDWVPITYAIAMGTGGLGSLLFGKLFDRRGLALLVPLTLLSTLYAPLAFLGGFPVAVVGAALWGVGMGVHESIIPAALAPMVGKERRASAYGLFTAGYGAAWFLGSALIGAAYDLSRGLAVGLCLGLSLASIPFFVLAARQR